MSRKSQRNRYKLQKSVYALGQSGIGNQPLQKEGRGLHIYTLSQLMGITGKNQQGDYRTVGTDAPYFYLAPQDRIRIAQLCTPVLGVVTSRMQRISGTRWKVTHDKKEEDRIYENMKNIYQIFKEYQGSTEVKYVIARAKLRADLSMKLPDLLPDMSNFSASLIRWRKNLQIQKINKCDEIWDWLQEPNGNTNWNDFIKSWVFDYHVHGAVAIYKETLNRRVENIYLLPGGTVIPARTKYVSSQSVFFQIIAGEQPQIFYPNELCFSQYVPISARSYGIIPLESLINKITENLLFDRLMAEQADGTKYPEKMIIINDVSPFGSLDKEMAMPIDEDEEKRIKEKLTEKVKAGIMTFSGNNATVVDLTRENTMGIQMQRQKDIREEVALVFNMSNMEINLTGSDSVSGRSTSEIQKEIDQGKGEFPILAYFENKFNREILPFRFGYDYSLKAEMSEDEREKMETLRVKMATGIYTTNEVREDENLNPFEDEEFNKPPGAQPMMQGSSEQQPVYMSEVKR